MVDQCKYIIALEFSEVKGLPRISSEGCGDWACPESGSVE